MTQSATAKSDDTEAREAPSPSVASKPQPGGIEVNDAKCIAGYANFCRVTGTPEELIVDFGLNKNMNPEPNQSIEIAQRIIVNFYTAKRLLAALHMAVQRHEAAFGVLETDVQRRVIGQKRSERGT